MRETFYHPDFVEAGHGPDDESILIHMRYALADVLELSHSLSQASKSDQLVIQQIIASAGAQVMQMPELQQLADAAAADPQLGTAA